MGTKMFIRMMNPIESMTRYNTSYSLVNLTTHSKQGTSKEVRIQLRSKVFTFSIANFFAVLLLK
jgi:hypothetical protein